MYTQLPVCDENALIWGTHICDENALIWGFPRQMFRPPATRNFYDVNNQYSYSYVKGTKWNSRCVADSKVS